MIKTYVTVNKVTRRMADCESEQEAWDFLISHYLRLVEEGQGRTNPDMLRQMRSRRAWARTGKVEAVDPANSEATITFEVSSW
jgi:hypothetical protein